MAASKKLGLWATTSLVIGNMVGAGIFLMPAALAGYGGISLLGWCFSAAGALLMAIVFSRLSKMLPGVNGGPYAYTREGFSGFMGFLVAWGYWISTWCANAALAVSFVSALSTFFPVLNGNAMAAALTGLSAIWLITWINTRGIVVSGNLQLVTTVLKLVPLVAVAFAGLFFINTQHFVPFNTSGLPSFEAITLTAATTLFAFLGIESATIPGASVQQADQTIPRATLLGTAITTAIYIGGTISVLGIVPAEQLQHSVTPFADAGRQIFGFNVQYIISGGVAIAALGALNGWILMQGQMPYAVAQDKLFPAVFARENKKGVPAAGILIGSLLVSVLLLMNYTRGLVAQFKFLILLSTLTSLVPYVFSMAAFVIIKLRRRNGNTPVTGSIIIALLAFLFAFWAVAGAGQEVVYWGFLLLIGGVPLYVWMVSKKMDS